MSAEQINELHKKIVLWVVEHAPVGWSKVIIDMELAFDGTEIAKSWVFGCFDAAGIRCLEIDAFGYDLYQMSEMFRELNDLMAGDDGERWGICYFTVHSNGKYEVEFSYEKPPRLNGDLLAGT